MRHVECSVECLSCLIFTCKTGILLGTSQDWESQALVKWWLQSPASLCPVASLHRGVLVDTEEAWQPDGKAQTHRRADPSCTPGGA